MPSGRAIPIIVALCVVNFLVACGGSGGGGSSETGTSSSDIEATPRTGANVISWIPRGDASSYTLYWSTTPGVVPAAANRVANVVAPYRHAGLTNGQTYYYVLTATGPSGESPPSIEVSATPDLGYEWTARIAGGGCACGSGLFGIAFGNNRFVAVGANGVVYSSTDGAQWTLQDIGGPSIHLHDVIWTGNEYIAAGASVSSTTGSTLYTPAIFTSGDGNAWTRRSTTWDGQTGASENSGTRVTSIAASGGGFVAIMGGRIFHSADGATWRSVLQIGPARVVRMNSQFLIAADQDGRILSSSNGTAWESRFALGSDYNLSDIAWSGSNYATVGKGTTAGVVAGSSDLMNWESALWQSGDSTNLRRVIWDGARYVAAGYRGVGSANVDGILVSRNGLNWTVAYLGNTFHRLNAIASSSQRLVAVGDDGAILTSP